MGSGWHGEFTRDRWHDAVHKQMRLHAKGQVVFLTVAMVLVVLAVFLLLPERLLAPTVGPFLGLSLLFFAFVMSRRRM